MENGLKARLSRTLAAAISSTSADDAPRPRARLLTDPPTNPPIYLPTAHFCSLPESRGGSCLFAATRFPTPRNLRLQGVGKRVAAIQKGRCR